MQVPGSGVWSQVLGFQESKARLPSDANPLKCKLSPGGLIREDTTRLQGTSLRVLKGGSRGSD